MTSISFYLLCLHYETSFLYFYAPNDRIKQIFDGSIDTAYDINPKFTQNSELQESFVINYYMLQELSFNSSPQIYIYTDVIYECLQKSSNIECVNLLKEFNFELLQKTIKENPKKDNKQTKL